jgi:hypothetical protein
MSETVVSGSIEIWRQFTSEIHPQEGDDEDWRLVRKEITLQAHEEETERRSEIAAEGISATKHQERPEFELRIEGFENENEDEDEDEDNGDEVADKGFAWWHHPEKDAIDQVIVMSELESSWNERQWKQNEDENEDQNQNQAT